MAIHNTMNHYLDAVEKKFGAEARQNTQLKHRGGSKFLLKHADANHPQVVDMGNLKLMAQQLHTNV